MRSGWHSGRRRLTRALPALIGCACLAGLAVPMGAGAAGLRPSAASAPTEAARIARYWTAARMSSARPLDEPEGRRILSATVNFGPVAEPTAPPYAVNGRLFLRQGRENGYCSATAINSPTRRLVLTAGHCVNSGPRSRKGNPVWSRYLEFVPAYSGGMAPFGTFVAHRDDVFAPRQWVRWGNPNFDVGAVLVSANASGVNVADAVGGGATIATNRSRQEDFQTFGYPGKTRRMQTCNSPYVGDDARTYPFPGPPTQAIRCRWAPGASGGGWLIEGGTVINGLTTYGHPGDRFHTFGPYFGRRNVGHLVAGL